MDCACFVSGLQGFGACVRCETDAYSRLDGGNMGCRQQNVRMLFLSVVLSFLLIPPFFFFCLHNKNNAVLFPKHVEHSFIYCIQIAKVSNKIFTSINFKVTKVNYDHM